ncbi:hypothetical protein BPC006_I2396 [Burkholderia pseudomallei BPC006]|nr:hypothetical protein BPC006_I2396 [Burkholderia pseudomallei BPC006]
MVGQVRRAVGERTARMPKQLRLGGWYRLLP